ncbi:hypothetical protein [Desulfosporosinus sp. Sb-LF]|uniref:hypothetical protein n=1 Tax=Desulfosporosinus sp. Sb-LF TaxID=2560027 RepID=UPI00107F37A6|nr:hypothetical protein [Desulfosporosinus sp. Sb-LF]TGE32540.1 hypothetical protein E4K68_10130 [Desulfosporosinus sp. Sb-LF]
MLTTQSKLTVQVTGFGERGSRQMGRPWPTGGSARPVRCPVSGVGRLNGSLLFCLRKDVALCHTASRGLGREDGGNDGDGRGMDRLGGRHISCAPSACKSWGRSLERKFAILLT